MPSNRRKTLRWGLLGLVAIVALVAWLASRGGDSEQGPQLLTASELREAAKELDHPLYWDGPALGAEYELRELEGDEDGAQVLYLPAEASSAGAAARALTFGSYPLADPAAAVEALAERPGAVVRHAEDGRLVVSNDKAPTSAYFAAPDNGVEVEVYAPSPGRAMRLALSGRVRPIR
jgi:hypothetical protein